MRPISRMLTAGALSLVVVVPLSPAPVSAAPSARQQAVREIRADDHGPKWLQRVNVHRAQAGLDPLRRSKKLSRANRLHARYMNRTGHFAHSERRGSAHSTKAGRRVAPHTLISYGSKPAKAVTSWMRAPFHALTLLRSDITRVGLGRSGTFVSLSVNGPRRKVQKRATAWPGPGVRTSVRRSVAEFPDQRTGCPAKWRNRAPRRLGAPVITTWKRKPTDVSATLRRGKKRVRVCVLTARTYRHPDAGTERIGRMLLRRHRAVVLIPLRKLRKATTYRVRVEAGGNTRRWKFRVTK